MSYILDALRRAESERDRGAVPTLHAQPVAAASNPAAGRRDWPWVPIAAGALAVALLGLAAGAFIGRPAPHDAAEQTAAAPVAVAPLPPTPPPRPAAEPTPPAAHEPAPPPKPAAAEKPSPTIATAAGAARVAPRAASAAGPGADRTRAGPAAAPPIPTAPAPARLGEGRAADRGLAVARAPVRSDVPTTPPSASSASSAAAARQEERVPSRAELPPDVQRALPELVIGGATHSSSAANRMLIVNGQVFREGDTLAPGLALEQIRLKTAVLRYGAHRYSITY